MSPDRRNEETPATFPWRPVRRAAATAVALTVAAALGCHSSPSRSSGGGNGSSSGSASSGSTPPNPVGATTFVSQPPGGSAGRGGTPMAGAAGGAATGQNGAASSSSGSSGATSGSSPAPRTIQEADIYKVSGDTLYVLNQYRGLQILDVSDLQNPQLVARVPVVGNPVDLYIEGNTAYVIVSDYFYYDMVNGMAGDAEATPWIGSQVWAVDVTTPSNPVVLGTLPVEGEVDDTRIVGNILYVVSNVYSYYYFGGGPAMGGAPVAGGATGGAAGGGSSSAAVTNQNLTFVASFDISNPKKMVKVAEQDFPAGGWNIHSNVTVNRVVIAESGWSQDTQGPTTQFEPIDISDPKGGLVLGTGYDASGMVEDRWAMDFDPNTNLFRAVMDTQQYSNQGGSLEIWNAPDVNHATPVGALVLNLPEAVTAASFDTGRAYVVTSYCTDPLWIIDTSDPTQPRLSGSVAMSGALDFLEPMGNQLIALGHDSDGCTAWEGLGQLAVSLFDVTDPTKPSMTSRVDFGGPYSAVTASSDDMKKAFQVLPTMNLILVPFQSWDDNNYQYTGGTQLIDFTGPSLTLRGFAQHDGSIERAFPVQNDIVAFSNRSLQVLDASDRDHPMTVAQIDLARPVLGLSIIGDQAVELSGDWTVGDTEIAVTSASTPDQPVPNAVVRIPSPNAQTFRDGSMMWILAEDYKASGTVAWLQGVDLSNPSAPVLRGKLPLDPSDVPNGFYGGWYEWGYGDETVIAGHALVIHRMYWGCYGTCGQNQPQDQLLVVDLSNPDNPSLAAPLTLPDSDWSWGLTAVGDFAWITHYEWIPNTNNGYVKYYLDRVDLTNPGSPSLLAKINVPGVFFAASPDGATIYTEQTTYDSDWTKATTWLNELSLLPGQNLAALVASTALQGSPGGAAINNGYAYVESWNYDDASGSSASLSAVNLSSMAVESSQKLGSDWAWIVKATGGKLFVEADWYDTGMVVYDLTKPGEPEMQGSIRTEGWVEDVVVNGTTAYLPSGEYGVPMVSLAAGAPLPGQM